MVARDTTMLSLAAVSLIVVAGMPWGGRAARQPTQFRSTTSGVRLDVSVSDGPTPLRGLKPQDFEVFDNGARQEFALVETRDAPLDLVLVLQPRGSMTAPRWTTVAQSAAMIGTLIGVDDRLAVVVASAPPRVAFGLRHPVGDTLPDPAPVTGDDRSAVRDAIVNALTLFDQQDRRKAVVLFADGQTDESWIGEQAVLAATERIPAQIIVAGIDTPLSTAVYAAWNAGGRAGEDRAEYSANSELAPPRWLLDIVRRSGGRVVDLRANTATNQVANLLMDLRTQYLITYTPQHVSTPGWHKIKVSVKAKRGVVLTRAGYWVTN